jgi:hypothetical protein
MRQRQEFYRIFMSVGVTPHRFLMILKVLGPNVFLDRNEWL